MTSKNELRDKIKLYYTVAKFSKSIDGFIVDEEAQQAKNVLDAIKKGDKDV